MRSAPIRRRLRRAMRAGRRLVALVLAIVAGAAAPVRAIESWRCAAMDVRVSEPCCPDEEQAPPEGAHLFDRCCERVGEAAPEAAALHDPGARLPSPSDLVAFTLPSLQSQIAASALALRDIPLAARPPGERLERFSAILRI